jgi:hypothetical protein
MWLLIIPDDLLLKYLWVFGVSNCFSDADGDLSQSLIHDDILVRVLLGSSFSIYLLFSLFNLRPHDIFDFHEHF